MSITRPRRDRAFYGAALLASLLLTLVAIYTLLFPSGGFETPGKPKDLHPHKQPDGNPYAPPISQIQAAELERLSRTHSQVLVVARTKQNDVSWITKELGELSGLQTAIYTVDDPASPNRVPQNKGNEVMVYLTYIIDNYHNLSDVTMFMHSHLTSWHDNALLDNSASMIKRLSSPKVMREGYMNMRCHLSPGCPAHIHPFSPTPSDKTAVPEEAIFADAWREIFPETPVPTVLSQPCCGQFAVSKPKLRAITRETYVHYRNWLIKTKLPNNLSGRVWEYVWQVIFAGVNEFCPKEHICYCDGYGVCFGGEKEYEYYFRLQTQREKEERERDEFKKMADQQRLLRLDEFEKKIKELNSEMESLKKKALEYGMDPEFRAIEVGRNWSTGDGY